MKDITEIFFRDVSTNIQLLVCNQFKIIMQTQYDPLRFYSKSELARLAGVSYSTFYRFLKTRQSVLETIGITLYAKKRPASHRLDFFLCHTDLRSALPLATEGTQDCHTD